MTTEQQNPRHFTPTRCYGCLTWAVIPCDSVGVGNRHTVSLPQLIHQALTEPVGPRCEARSESGVGATGRPRGPKITPEPPPATIAERLVPHQRSRRPGRCPPVTMRGDMDTCPTERIAHSPVPRGTPKLRRRPRGASLPLRTVRRRRRSIRVVPRDALSPLQRAGVHFLGRFSGVSAAHGTRRASESVRASPKLVAAQIDRPTDRPTDRQGTAADQGTQADSEARATDADRALEPGHADRAVVSRR